MKKISLCLALGLFCLAKANAQDKPDWDQTFKQINDEVLQHSQAYQTLKQATETIGHRLTGSENGAKAEQLAYDLLHSYGFDDVSFQPFNAESWSRGSLDFKIRKGNGVEQAIKAVSLAHAPMHADVNGEVVDMGSGVESDYIANPGKAKGKIVLAYLGLLPDVKEGSKNLHRSEKAALAIKYGAKAMILYNTVPGGVLLTGTASVTGSLIPIPVICIGLEDGLALKDSLARGSIEAVMKMTNHAGQVTARNVIARIKGTTHPEEKIVVGGHLDSWDLATGAIDNGIGSFAVIDMARTLKKLNLKPSRTLEFVLFMGEEEGLLGSKAYIKQAIADKSIDQIRYMLNYDMTNDPRSYGATTDDDRSLFEAIGKKVQAIDPYFQNHFAAHAGLHSDHQPFMLQGIPTGGGNEGNLPKDVLNCYHADCDTFNLVDEQGLKNTVRFSAILAYALADAPEIASKRLTDEEIKALLIKNNLEEALRISGDWRW